VDVGLTEVEPLPDCELKLPGEIEMVVAPLADQLSVLLPPEVMLVGLAAKEVIEGAEAVPPLEPVLVEPVDVPDPVLDVFVGLVVCPQAARPTQSSTAENSAPRESCANRMVRLETGDPIVDTPHASLPLARADAILAARTELVAVPGWGLKEEHPLVFQVN
jgi:hypothetical protein